MYLQVLLEAAIALFAVFGLYCFVRLLLQKLLTPSNFVLMIELLDKDDAEHAEELIKEALTQIFGVSKNRIAVVATEELAEDERLLELLELYGLDCYVID